MIAIGAERGNTIIHSIYLATVITGSLILTITLIHAYKRSKTAQTLVYSLSINTTKGKILLEKTKKKGFLAFEKTKAFFSQNGYFLHLELRSRKTNQLLVHLSNKKGHWHRDDILSIVATLKTGLLPLVQKKAPFGLTSKQSILFKNGLFSIQNIVLLLAWIVLGVVQYYAGYLQRYPIILILLWLVTFLPFMYTKRRCIVTPQHLTIKNIWWPFYKCQFPIADVSSIALIKDESSFLKIITAQKTQKFSTQLSDHDLQQIVFLVQERIKQLHSPKSIAL